MEKYDIWKNMEKHMDDMEKWETYGKMLAFTHNLSILFLEFNGFY
jgi:hypothetical protein